MEKMDAKQKPRRKASSEAADRFLLRPALIQAPPPPSMQQNNSVDAELDFNQFQLSLMTKLAACGDEIKNFKTDERTRRRRVFGAENSNSSPPLAPSSPEAPVPTLPADLHLENKLSQPAQRLQQTSSSSSKQTTNEVNDRRKEPKSPAQSPARKNVSHLSRIRASIAHATSPLAHILKLEGRKGNVATVLRKVFKRDQTSFDYGESLEIGSPLTLISDRDFEMIIKLEEENDVDNILRKYISTVEPCVRSMSRESALCVFKQDTWKQRQAVILHDIAGAKLFLYNNVGREGKPSERFLLNDFSVKVENSTNITISSFKYACNLTSLLLIPIVCVYLQKGT